MEVRKGRVLGVDLPLSRLILLPVLLALALVAVVVAVMSVAAGRMATGDELENRADGVQQVSSQAFAERQDGLAAVARKLAPQGGREAVRAASRRKVAFAAVTRNGRIAVARGERWSRIAPVRAFAKGSPKRSVVALGDGRGAVLVAASLPGGGRLLLGEPLDARGLDALAAPLGAGLSILPSEGTAPGADGYRSYEYPLDQVRGGNGRLRVLLPADSLQRATQVPLIAALGAVLAIAALLAWLVRRLLARSVTAPLHQLEVAMARTGAGDLKARADLDAPPEIARAGERFNTMTARLVEREEKLEADAARDPLTGLANSHRLEETVAIEIKRAQRDGTPFTVAMLDIDGFTHHNERIGREHGDELLREVAAALVKGTRDTDLVARVQADQFALVLLGVEGDVALSVMERLRTAVANAGGGVSLGSSVGYVHYPADGHDARTLLEGAEGALDWARRGGAGSMRRFDSRHVVLRGNEDQRAEVLSMLERDDGLTVVFQPIVSLSTGKILGYEALARFHHESKRGPDVWFAQAHRCGLGAQLEAKAVKTALLFPGRPSSTWLSLNLSPNALQSEALDEVLPQNLDGIVIELTEHEQIWDDEALQKRLDGLRSRGAKIAVDDAGAGYAGLQQVMRIQPDVIKLDRSLIRGVDDDIAKAALVDSIVRFARRSGATVCGEGIETEEELRALADLDVSCGQGYLLARPGAPWPTVLAWVERDAAAAHTAPARLGHPQDPPGGRPAARRAELRALTPTLAVRSGRPFTRACRRDGRRRGGAAALPQGRGVARAARPRVVDRGRPPARARLPHARKRAAHPGLRAGAAVRPGRRARRAGAARQQRPLVDDDRAGGVARLERGRADRPHRHRASVDARPERPRPHRGEPGGHPVRAARPRPAERAERAAAVVHERRDVRAGARRPSVLGPGTTRSVAPPPSAGGRLLSRRARLAGSVARGGRAWLPRCRARSGPVRWPRAHRPRSGRRSARPRRR